MTGSRHWTGTLRSIPYLCKVFPIWLASGRQRFDTRGLSVFRANDGAAIESWARVKCMVAIFGNFKGNFVGVEDCEDGNEGVYLAFLGLFSRYHCSQVAVCLGMCNFRQKVM